MDIQAAIASGKPYKRPCHDVWSIGPLRVCTWEMHEGAHVVHPCSSRSAREFPCSGFESTTVGTGEWTSLGVEGYAANDWILRRTEEDFEKEALDIIQGLGLKVGDHVKA